MKPLKPFKKLPQSEWSRIKPGNTAPNQVWLSAQYLVQEFNEKEGVVRLTISSTKHKNGIWKDGLTWDELYAIKNAIGYSNRLALEVFPEVKNLVNVANMRHLFIIPDESRPSFAWTRNVGSIGNISKD
ncbi:DUF7694 domain-containing protein [Vibrio parahaemolyticus]|uniref:DUF7694 domain-containing protein n=1 Tax=Vibrio parahaemolyticus TaxID=670 RepID=UPI000C99DB8D|nr:hypothetical protein [Vibrio parahaemolyticus]PMS91933.1 hypothetical protein C1T06_22845 [Vibrio parahaemolyticus]